MKKLVLLLSMVTAVFAGMAQSSKAVKWEFSSKKLADKSYEIHLTASIDGDFHLYAQQVGVDGPVPTKFTFRKNPLLTVDSKIAEIGKVIKKNEEVWGGVVHYYENSVDFVLKVKVKGTAKTNLAGSVEFMVCNDEKCLPPAEVPFTVSIGG